MIVATQAIVLKVNTYKESDVLTTLLTQELGKITCVARSAKKSKHRFFSGIGMLDSGTFHLSKNKSNHFQIDTISHKVAVHKGMLHPTKFLHACLFAEIFDLCMPEEDPECGQLYEILKKGIFYLEKSDDTLKYFMISSWLMSKLSMFSGIDPRANESFFRTDDMTWIKGLCIDTLTIYEPQAASHRALVSLVRHIEKIFEIRSKVISQILN